MTAERGQRSSSHLAAAAYPLKLGPSLLGLTAVAAVPPDRFRKVLFRFPHLLAAGGRICRRRRTCEQQRSAKQRDSNTAFQEHARLLVALDIRLFSEPAVEGKVALRESGGDPGMSRVYGFGGRFRIGLSVVPVLTGGGCTGLHVPGFCGAVGSMPKSQT